jgi:hypothetical protein
VEVGRSAGHLALGCGGLGGWLGWAGRPGLVGPMPGDLFIQTVCMFSWHYASMDAGLGGPFLTGPSGRGTGPTPTSQWGPPNPTRRASCRNPTQEGQPDPAIHPTDRNRNLALTPSKRASGLVRRTRHCPSSPSGPLVQLFLLFPDPGCTVTTIKKSGQSNDQPKTTTRTSSKASKPSNQGRRANQARQASQTGSTAVLPPGPMLPTGRTRCAANGSMATVGGTGEPLGSFDDN